MEEENNKLNTKLAEMLQLENEKHLREAEEIRQRMDREKEELQASLHQVSKFTIILVQIYMMLKYFTT